jgi:hypothetical protein
MARWLAVAAALAFLAGCGSKKTTTVTMPGGSVTTSEDSSGKQTSEFKGQEGEARINQSDEGATAEFKDKSGNVTNVETGKGVDVAGAGIPVYPGSQVDDEGKAAAQVTGSQGTHSAAAFTTSDPPTKVIDWYAGQLKTDQKTTTPEGGMVMGKNDKGDQVIVVVGTKEGKTTIGVQVMQVP